MATGLRPETLAIGILRLESLKNPRVFRPGSVKNITLCSPLTDLPKFLTYNKVRGLDSPGGVKC